MKVSEIIAKSKPTLSFEVFPPKTDMLYDSVMWATKEIAALMPHFMSVTYGALGGSSRYTASIAQNIKTYGVTPIAHLTCINSSKADILNQLSFLKAAGIENILALRGDIVNDSKPLDFKYASDLVSQIKSYSDFCVGAACYPEGHPESSDAKQDFNYLLNKINTGCDFLTTQMFFDNNVFFEFQNKLEQHNVKIPVIAGIMPVVNAKSINRIVELSGTKLPTKFKKILERYGDDPIAMQQAGIAYATDQIIDLLANNVSAIHVYSMNKPLVAKKIKENLSQIIK